MPNLLRDLFAEGALSAAFVTTFSQTITKQGEKAAWRLANLVNNGLIVVLSVVVLSGVCLLYTSDAADERSSVDLGGRRIIKKKKKR